MLREAFNTRTSQNRTCEDYCQMNTSTMLKLGQITREDRNWNQYYQQPTDYSGEVNKHIAHVVRQEGLWTAIEILEMSRNQIPLKITVNSKERKIEYVEVDREVMKNAKRSQLDVLHVAHI